MADIVLPPLLRVFFEKLAFPILEELGHYYGLEKEIEKLRHSIPTIQAVLEDAEERQVNDKAVRLWMVRLKDVLYDAEDLLDEYMTEVLLMKRSSFSSSTPLNSSALSFIVKFGRLPKLKAIVDTLDVIVREKSNFNLTERVVKKRPESAGSRQTGSFVIESGIYGRDEDREKIVKLLLSSNTNKSRGNVSTVSIVGIGGLGKTTLAQLAYNDERVKMQFELRMWVYVSDNFDLRWLIKAIIESATESVCDILVMDVLQSQLWESLRGKRYLLVLDDVWNEDHDEWDKLKTLLSGGTQGSKIVVTTRSEKVALIMGTESLHHLEVLSEDDCWALFKQRAFHMDEETEHPNLLVIGKEIVKKCGGVPLAAMTLGSLMLFEREEREWLFVQDSELWTLCELENGILPALRLSYNHLPSHLKPCFAFCSIFPKSYEINKEKLIHLWIAQDLVISSGGNRTLEDVGNVYFNNLLWMFFFQDVKTGADGNIKTCKMHDIIHDLARSVAGNEFITLESGNATSSLARARHLSVICNFQVPAIPQALYEAKKLRTLLLLFRMDDVGGTLIQMFSNFRCLRMLDLSWCGIQMLDESIDKLKFLRYLDLSNTYIVSLPETICDLCHLQTLKLLDCHNLVELPVGLGMITSLRHVNISGCESLTHMPPMIERLVHLQTLPIFIVHNRGYNIEGLGYLNLRGELNIKCLENVRFATQAKSANLELKNGLDSLGLFWEDGDKSSNVKKASGPSLSDDVEAVMSALSPPPYLKRLSVKGYMGVCFPSWMKDISFRRLKELVLINIKRCEDLPIPGKFPLLEVVYLHGMDAVKCIECDFYGDGTIAFPSLKELTLREFHNLKEWSTKDGIELFPSLRKLTINNCPELTIMPWFPSLQHLELRNCKTMILTSVKNVTSLSLLIIDVFPELLHLPEGLLHNNPLLASLTISSCPKLRSLSSELGTLSALKSLTIRWCDELASLPQDLGNLTSLESLEICECPSLLSLPEELQGLVLSSIYVH